MSLKVRQSIAAFLLSLAVVGLVGGGMIAVLLMPRPALAADAPGNPVEAGVAAGIEAGGAAASVTPGSDTSDAMQTVSKGVVSPLLQIALVTGLLNIFTFVTDRLAYESAVFIASGGKGQTPLLYADTAEQAWTQFGKDVAGEAIGQLGEVVSTGLDIKFDICSPQLPEFKLALQLGIAQQYKPGKPKCDFDSTIKNWESFIATTSATAQDPVGSVLKGFSVGLSPGRNELSASIAVSFLVQQEANQQRQINIQEQLANNGYKNVVDTVTGKVQTPASFLEAEVKKSQLEDPSKPADLQILNAINNADLIWGLFGHVASTFTNTLLSTTIDRISKGMAPLVGGDNPFDIEALSNGGREAAQQQFRSLITANPISVSNYNLLAEFVVCPAGGPIPRNINNCVMDPNFAAAVTRSDAGIALTVRDAMSAEEGLLNPNWALFPATNKAKNQDPFCYTNAFCYGNLVKLRKARIIPVGWEIAATINASFDPPKTLKEIVDSYNDCGGGNPFCHLIDPNWILKYPETQCKSFVNGEIPISSASGARNTYCADVLSCLSEDSKGNCTGGFGYCVREKNIWRFRGEECPEQFASCLAFTNTIDNERTAFLANTVDFSVCNQGNAGCRWYRVNKYFDGKGTLVTTDDTFSFLPTGGTYNVPAWDNSIQSFAVRSGANTEDGLYAFEDRVYFNKDVKQCDGSQVGCGELTRAVGVTLNQVRNPGFEASDEEGGLLAGWTLSGLPAPSNDPAEGSRAADLIANTVSQKDIELSAGSFYTFSFESKGATVPTATVVLSTLAGASAAPNIAGTNARGCTITGNTVSVTPATANASAYVRSSCTFTTGATSLLAEIRIQGTSLVDAIQLERGENATDFANGYSDANAQSVALKVPPAYLNCKGLPTDPALCDEYAEVCSAQEVGCELYTPEDGDPSVPAVASLVDQCPGECVGYAAYKQEPTKYEGAKFPLFFIPAKAQSCDAQFVGCDAFTNLDAGAGGETVEHYTNLRACVLPDPAQGSTVATAAPNRTQAPFFTWEGTDASGFQLRSFTLLKSNRSAAPCTQFRLDSPTLLLCNEPASLPVDLGCDLHDDIFTNPDCREFYDGAGIIHYRRFSKTVTVDSQCHEYRKTAAPTATDCNSTGGFSLPNGDCRYLGLPSESVQCPASASGCRSYTGGAGRNATTVINEGFESGTFAPWNATGATLTVSNESVSAGGHSLRVTDFSGNDTVNYGDFEGKLVAGKTFVLEFWAKGSGTIQAKLGGEDVGIPVSLSQGWRPYSVGPLDASLLASITDASVLQFTEPSGTTDLFLDNVVLKQVEDNITLIKGSFVVPASCDQTSTGTASPQFFLGCEGYTDRANQSHSFYQFTSLCSEAKVGCEAFYDERNSTSPYGETHNARCVGPVGACSYLGKNVCSVQPGKAFCLFDFDGAIRTIANTAAENKVNLGPETRVIPNDVPVFLVNNGAGQCSPEAVGCEEVGVPVFNVDKTRVTKFDAEFLIIDPLVYGDEVFKNTLCSHEALFCDEWKSTKDGNYYFKNPLGQNCEYKTDVSISSRRFFGWFRKGTNDPCEYVDVNNDGAFTLGTDTPRARGGNEFLLPTNGDAAYRGFVGQCAQQFDQCTEFRDPTDRSTEHRVGLPYYFRDTESLEKNTGAIECNGRVGRENGCGLFFDATDSSLLFAAEPTYIASVHADVLFNAQAQSLVDPISCPNGGSGNTPGIDLCKRRCQYTLPPNVNLLSASSVEGANVATQFEYVNGCFIDTDCPVLIDTRNIQHEAKCVDVPAADSNAFFTNDTNRVLNIARDRECGEWLACTSSRPTFDTTLNAWRDICEEVKACDTPSPKGGLACGGPIVDNKAVALTAEAYKNRNVQWTGMEYTGYAIPRLLPVDQVEEVLTSPAKWCVTALGATPSNVESRRTCATDDDCSSGKTCENAPPVVNLGHVAGGCETPASRVIGLECQIGVCSISAKSCSTTSDCGSGGPEDVCVFGYCKYENGDRCSVDTDCDTPGFGICDFGSCVRERIPNSNVCGDPSAAPEDRGCAPITGSAGACVPAPESAIGQCYNNLCVTGITQSDERVEDITEEETTSCRGYPESFSPYAWDRIVTNAGEGSPKAGDSVPFSALLTKLRGFDGATPCSLVQSSSNAAEGFASNECECSYSKETYGKGALSVLYFKKGTEAPERVCIGGSVAGKTCETAAECLGGDATSSATCERLTRSDQVFGWDGLCLERDSSIPLFGDDVDDPTQHPCITWLPVDQLRSSTNLFAKAIGAGSGLDENRYYCAETSLYVDLYPTGAIMDDEGTVTDIDLACSTSNFDCNINADFGGTKHLYGTDVTYKVNGAGADVSKPACIANAFCPTGYVALLGICKSDPNVEPPTADQIDEEGCGTDRNCYYDKFARQCRQDSKYEDQEQAEWRLKRPRIFNTALGNDQARETSDCPYFCIPKEAVHTQGDDAGIACIGEVQSKADQNQPETSRFGTEVYRMGDLAKLGNSATGGDTTHFRDCAVRGVPVASETKYEPNWNTTRTTTIEDDGTLLTSDPTVITTPSRFSKGGYRFISVSTGFLELANPNNNPDSDAQGSYGLAYRTPDTVFSTCSNTGQICETQSECPTIVAHERIVADCVGMCAVVILATSVPSGGTLLLFSPTTYPVCLAACIIAGELPPQNKCVNPEFDPANPTTTQIQNGFVDQSNALASDELRSAYQTAKVSGAVYPYLGCQEIVQVTQKATEDSPPENKSWTQRLFEAATSLYTAVPPSQFNDNGAPHMTYQADDIPAPAGKLFFEEFYKNVGGDAAQKWIPKGIKTNDAVKDAWPAPVSSDNSGPDHGLLKFGYGFGNGVGQYEDYPKNAQYRGVEFPSEAHAFSLGLPYEDVDGDPHSLNAWRGLVADTALDTFGGSSNANDLSIGGGASLGTVNGLLEQFYGKVVARYKFDWKASGFGGAYITDPKTTNQLNDFSGNPDTNSGVADNPNGPFPEGKPGPIVHAVGECIDDKCLEIESSEGISINGLSSGDLIGTGGSLDVIASFYTFAQPNQLPLRQVVIDWGNGDVANTTAATTARVPMQVGEASLNDSFYRNFRGFEEVDDQLKSLCNEDVWGGTPESCETRYVSFNRLFTCTPNDLLKLEDRACVFDGTKLTNSPCLQDDACVFQPRVFVQDNWGWCTGECTSNEQDATDECYESSECDTSFPHPLLGPDNDPWVYYNGTIIVQPL